MAAVNTAEMPANYTYIGAPPGQVQAPNTFQAPTMFQRPQTVTPYTGNPLTYGQSYVDRNTGQQVNNGGYNFFQGTMAPVPGSTGGPPAGATIPTAPPVAPAAQAMSAPAGGSPSMFAAPASAHAAPAAPTVAPGAAGASPAAGQSEAQTEANNNWKLMNQGLSAAGGAVKSNIENQAVSKIPDQVSSYINSIYGDQGQYSPANLLGASIPDSLPGVPT